MRSAAATSTAQFGLVALAFGLLMHAFATSDFTVSNVAENSSLAKPMLFKVAGTWGSHEGSLLLWILILALFGAGVALFAGNLPLALKARTLSVQAWISAGFLSFLLFTSNPFARVFPAPLDGADLNPLLQDIGLAMHPPLLYLGYVGFSIVFSFAIAALIEGRVDPAWARWVRPWALLAWGFLTAGIALGSWWAYYELGWGGWWFWDPVENVSFMPWLLGTALLHSAIVTEKRDTFKSWTILLAILTFQLEPSRHVHRALGAADLGARLRGRSGARRLHPDAARRLDRRLARALRLAGAEARGRRPLRADQPRGGTARQQPPARDRHRDGPLRHALPALPRGGDGRARSRSARPSSTRPSRR